MFENRGAIFAARQNAVRSEDGNVVKWMDEVGAMSAMRLAGSTCVTARINGLDFERPIPQGDICAIESYAYDAGTSSVVGEASHVTASGERTLDGGERGMPSGDPREPRVE
ncbi:hypothetical protein GCM10009000_095560 [Halobacterium noricense]